MRDTFGRRIDYLRLSVTDRCNLNCRYCIPAGEGRRLTHDECLRYEEMARVVAAFIELGGRKVRITGGEPLLKPGLTALVALLAGLDPAPELALTTNGVLLEGLAQPLKAAGLRRVNISLDTLDPATFTALAGTDALDRVIRGIDAAVAAGLTPVRLNSVILRGVNDGELDALLEFARARGLEMRFIEQMPVPGAAWQPVTGEELRSRLVAAGRTVRAVAESAAAAAVRYDVDGQTVGFISPRAHGICARCSRLRLSYDGKLRPCLGSEAELDLRAALRSGQDLRPLLREAVRCKPATGLRGDRVELPRAMVRTGG